MSELDRGCSGAYLDLPAEMSDPASAVAAVLPVPYDGTSTWRKGADKGPAALIAASAIVEWYDIETGTEMCRRGITTLPALEHAGDPVELAQKVRARVGAMFDRGWFPVVLGGEHSISVGSIEAAAERHPGLVVVQIDAHGDTRESYEGLTHNHACVMARARGTAGVSSVVQIGLRAIEASEMSGLDPARTFFAWEIVDARDESWMGSVAELVRDRPVYVTIDMDAFDPSLVPATGTPEPGGLSWGQVNRVLAKIARSGKVVGFDVVELCPQPGAHASEMVAAKLVYRLLTMIFVER